MKSEISIIEQSGVLVQFNRVQFGFGSRLDLDGNLDGGIKKLSTFGDRPSFKQVHSNRVSLIKIPGQNCGEIDGVWTRLKRVPLQVVTADCVPILFVSADEQAIAALHSGWRGTYFEIARSLFKDSEQTFYDGVAILGPHIKSCCYSVSTDLAQDFKKQFGPNVVVYRDQKVFLDLTQTLRLQLKNLGIKKILDLPYCTHCSRTQEGPRFESYRRQGVNSLRQYSWVERLV